MGIPKYTYDELTNFIEDWKRDNQAGVKKPCSHSWYASTPLYMKCMDCGKVIDDPAQWMQEQRESAKNNFEDMGLPRDGYYK